MASIQRRLLSKLILSAALGSTLPAYAQEVLKIGVVGPMTGPFAVIGQDFKNGVQAYMAMHGDRVGGRKIEVIYRDSGGSDPTLAKRLAEELIVKDKVSMLAGFYLTPEAAATAPVINQAKVPLFIAAAATPALSKMSHYFIRMGQTIHVPAELGAEYARQSGKSRGFTAVGDYAPGHVVEEAFAQKFKALGGEIVGAARIALNTTDFSAVAERIANSQADVIEVFLPPGAVAVGFVKALAARGLTGKVMVIGQGEADDSELHLFDDSVLGFRSIIYLDANATNAENRKFFDWLKKNAGPNVRPNSFNIGTYDAMRLMYKVIGEQAGKPFSGDAAVKSLAGYTYDSPRGSVTYDAATRENIMDYHLRETVKEGGVKINKVIKTWPKVKASPWK